MQSKTGRQDPHLLQQQHQSDDYEDDSADNWPAIAFHRCVRIHLLSPAELEVTCLRRLSLIHSQMPPAISRTGHHSNTFQSKRPPSTASFKWENGGNSLLCNTAMPAQANPTATTAS